MSEIRRSLGMDAESELLADLENAERSNTYRSPGSCKACDALSALPDGELKSMLERALAGTIGNERLAAILTRHGLQVGRRAIIRHRREGH